MIKFLSSCIRTSIYSVHVYLSCFISTAFVGQPKESPMAKEKEALRDHLSPGWRVKVIVMH